MSLFSELFAVMIMMQVITFPRVAGTNKVAEMQLKLWREKLPNIQVPETVAASMSPLTQEELSTFVKIIKDGNLRFHATQFCNSANLLCYQSVDVLRAPITSFSSIDDLKLSNTGDDLDLSKTTDDLELSKTSDMFFPAKELKEGGQITLPTLYSPWKAFLPRDLSQLFPFATVALSDVLSSFGIPERSNMAVDMNNTLIACEDEHQQGENRTCTTSIEGIIEFVLSNLGSSDSLQLVTQPALTAESGKKARVSKVIQKQSGPSNRPPLSCHRFVYLYGVFYCHSVNGTLTYSMELEVLERHGKMYNATALCHPNLRIKGSFNCHLISGDTLLWLIKDEH